MGWMKAQATPEFLVIFAALMTAMLMFFVIYQDQEINLFQAQDTLATGRNAYAAAAAINYVHLAGDGAEYNFTLSGVAGGENITVYGNSVESGRRHAVSQAPLLTPNVNTSTLEGGNMLITNHRGEIRVG